MTGPFPRRSPIPLLGIVFAAALAVRLAYLFAFRGSPFFDHLVVDARWHDEWALAWARGEWSPEGRAFFRAPLYPLWLSFLYRLFGHDLFAVRLVQAVLGAGTAAVLAGAGYRLAGRGAALAAGLVAAGYGTLVFFDGELLIPNLLLALLSGALFALLGPPTRANAVLAGALLGLAAVARPNALVLLPVAVGWAILARGAVRESVEPGPPGGGRGSPARRRWARGALVAALGLLPALAVTAYNARVEGAAVFISSQGGVNFYAGNHARASGRGVEIPELDDVSGWRGFVERARSLAEGDVGRPLDSREVSNWWLHRGLRWLRENPGDAARLTLRKAVYLVNAFETPSNRDVYFDRRGPLRALLWKTRVLAFPWGLLFPLAAAGFVAGWRDPRLRAGVGLLLVWSVLYAASLVPFFINARFRLALVPAMVLLAAVVLSRPRRLLAGPPLAAALAALVLANANLAGARIENPGQELARLGHVLVRDGRLEEARDALEEARRREPRSITTALELARVYAELGRSRDALHLYEEAVRLRPDDAALRFEMAVEYLKIDEYEPASRMLEEVVRQEPDHAAAWVDLGFAYEGRGLDDRAADAYRRGIARAPFELMPYLRLSDLLLARGDVAAATAELEAAVDRLPASAELRYRLARVYAEAGRLDRAREEADMAERLDPDDGEYRRFRERLESEP